jgi:thiol-disulfide isomerase/thioredoxin
MFKYNQILALILIFTASSFATEKKVPSIKIKDIKGKEFNTGELSNDGKPMIINFWATWCKPCIKELNNIQEVYPDWVDETGVKIVAVSIDDARNSRKVAPFISARGWDYEILIDENGDFRRAMNVQNPPHTFLVNGKGEVVWQHNGYAPGDEEELYEEVQKLVK